MAADRRPLIDPNPGDSYDVDALLVELGADDGLEEAERAVCQTVERLHAPAARFQMIELIGDFLDGLGITPTEFLHRVDPQERFQAWHRRGAALERLSRAQARPGRRSPAQRREELERLEEEAMALTRLRAHPGVPVGLDARGFAAVVIDAHRRIAGFPARFAVDGLLAAWLGGAGMEGVGVVGAKLVQLLSLDAVGVPAEGIAAIDQIVGECLASPAADDLFAWADGPRGAIEAMVQVWKGDAPTHPDAPSPLCRVAAFIGDHQAPAARLGLEMASRRWLEGEAPLTPVAPTARNPVSALIDELEALGALAGEMTIQGALVGGWRTRHLLDRRGASLLAEDRLEALLAGKSEHSRLTDLLTIEPAVWGETGRRLVTEAIQRRLDHRDFTQRLFEGARTPRARIKALADLQRRVLRSGLPDAARDRHARMLDDIQHTHLRANRLLARLAKDGAPGVDDVMEHATLLAEGAFTQGKAATAMRDLVTHHAHSTPFLRAYLARLKDVTDQRGERFARFFAIMAEAGVPMRAMDTVKALVADDEPAARAYVEMILRDLGVVDVTLAPDGREALNAFNDRPGAFDLIVCDWKMPRLSGLELLKRVRAQRPDMPFLMVTALATLIAVEEAVAHDVTAYIAKPFSPERLEEKILVLVNR